MDYYEIQVPRELVIGEKYTVTQLALFLQENDDTTILSKSVSQLSINNDRELELLDKIEAYNHYFSNERYAYIIPDSKSNIYIFE